MPRSGIRVFRHMNLRKTRKYLNNSSTKDTKYSDKDVV